MTAPDISIVVCTFNRAAMLRQALASLSELTTGGQFQCEIVVIDNASTDDTQQVIAAAALASKHPLRGIRESEKGIVPARNRGVHEARGRWIAFFDDDQLADPQWLVELRRGAAERQCRVVGGAVHLALPDNSSRQLDATVRMLLGESILSDRPLPYGGRITPGCGNLMIERSVFEEVGVFERTVSGRGEDTDLFARIERAGIASWYIPTAIIQHLTPHQRLELSYLLRLARYMGEGIAGRQAAQLGRVKFAALWLAKALRACLVHYPLLLVARLKQDHEAQLGRRCLLAITAAFLRTGSQCLGFSRRRAAPLPAHGQAAALVPGISPK